MSKKILFISHGYKPATNLGGPIESVSALAENIMKQSLNYEINVCCTTDNLTSFITVENSFANINNVKVLYFNSFFQDLYTQYK